jgi:DNA-binding transcriptional LysR family regulator
LPSLTPAASPPLPACSIARRPAVSLQIKRLEQLLGHQLFEREHRKLRLAPIGELLIASAQRMVSLNDDLWGRMTTPSFSEGLAARSMACRSLGR